MDLNDLVEIAPGVTKPLGDCTEDDLAAAMELTEVKGRRNRAAAARLGAGLPPVCDWQNADGTPAVWLMDGTSLISGANIGANLGSSWHVVPQHHDLFAET